MLRQQLKGAKKLPRSDKKGRSGWDAHHIIPTYESDPNVRTVQAAAFGCHVRPAAVRNGVFLRNKGLEKGTDAYKRLPRGLKKRTYHYDTQHGVYFKKLKATLVGAGVMDRFGNCTSNHTRFYDVLDGINRRLRQGKFIPDTGR